MVAFSSIVPHATTHGVDRALLPQKPFSELERHLQETYPKLNVKVIDERFWLKAMPELAETMERDLPPLDVVETAKKIAEAMETIAQKIEGDLGATFLTVPPISLKQLAMIAKKLNDNIDLFHLVADDRFNIFLNLCSGKAERILITNNILDKSRKKSVPDLFKTVKHLGWEAPHARQIATLAIAEFLTSENKREPNRLFTAYSPIPRRYCLTYSICKENLGIDGKIRHLIVGAFSLSGLFLCDYNGDADDIIGIAAVRHDLSVFSTPRELCTPLQENKDLS